MRKTVIDIDDLYPSSDGEPMTDKDINRLLMEYVELTLAQRYEKDANTYVSANLFIYYEEGNPKKCIAPDVFMVQGVEKKIRERYLLWEEGGKVPEVAFEFMARRRKQRDAVQKKAIYEQLGVKEYYIFDPYGTKLNPRFRAFRLVDGRYQELAATDGAHSDILGLDIVVDGDMIRLRDPKTGYVYPLPVEGLSQLHDERLRADVERQKAEEERQRAEEASRGAEAERRRVEELETEVVRLRRLLEEKERG